jgi:hypothetical protein
MVEARASWSAASREREEEEDDAVRAREERIMLGAFGPMGRYRAFCDAG